MQLSKSKKTSTSNWAQQPLTDKQIAYAANDAHVALLVYQRWLTLQPAIRKATQARRQRRQRLRHRRYRASVPDFSGKTAYSPLFYKNAAIVGINKGRFKILGEYY
jgi:ribonuclease D